MTSADQSEPDNLACLAGIQEVIQGLKELNATGNTLSTNDMIHEIISLTENSQPLIEASRSISSELAKGLEDLAEVMSEATDNARMRLEGDEESGEGGFGLGDSTGVLQILSLN